MLASDVPKAQRVVVSLTKSCNYEADNFPEFFFVVELLV